MNSKVIKCVAGAGKTTYSEEYMSKHKNGIYLAFNNSVVNKLRNKGYLCKTIDSFFSSFIIPKFTSVIPLIASGSVINYVDSEKIAGYLKGMANIKIKEDGSIYNQKKKTIISLNTKNEDLHLMKDFTNCKFIKFIFDKDSLNINDQLRAELSLYIIKQYGDKVIEFLASRFSYIIIDEAQDLKGYREEFAKLLYNSSIKLILLGDDNQNINAGGRWFESLTANEYKNQTFRCSDKICAWIRTNLDINICGNSSNSEYKEIKSTDVMQYDDGKRVLLYSSNTGYNKEILNKWQGSKQTIKKSKGNTIENDVVIIGKSLNIKNLYTAITRTTKNVYSTISTVNRN